MDVLLGFIFVILTIVLIIGLFKPKTILRKSKKYTRLKIVFYWFLGFLIIGLLINVNEKHKGKSKIEEAINLIELREYSEAIKTLKNIKEDNQYFMDAEMLIQKADSLNKIAEEEKLLAIQLETKVKLKEQLELEIESIDKGVDFSIYNGSIEALQMEIDLFHQWTLLFYEGKNSDDPEIQILAQQLINKVSKIQSKEFPRLRKEYAKTASKLMWENDIEVTSNGTGNKYVNFTGVIFAANKNKQEFHNEINDVLKKFRFNQARYKWFDQASEYSYRTIYKGSDSDLLF